MIKILFLLFIIYFLEIGPSTTMWSISEIDGKGTTELCLLFYWMFSVAEGADTTEGSTILSVIVLQLLRYI